MQQISKQVISRIRKEYGEAFYLLDSKQFRNNFIELKNAFSLLYPNFNIAYSYKTNYIPRLCKIVNELGGYAEVVSEMEVELAQKCGVKPDHIIWNGPIKNPIKMEELLLAGGTVNIDSINEAEYIEELSKKTDKTLNVGLRCNYDVGDGEVSRFGFDIEGEDFKKVMKIVTTSPNLHLISFQCHFAKRQLQYWTERIKGMLRLLDSVGIIPERIDLGGGLFGKMEDSLKSQFGSFVPEYNDYARCISTFAEYFKNKCYKPELLIEPGSAIVGDCMSFVGTVKSIKTVRDKCIATVLCSQKNINMSSVNPPIDIVHFSEGNVFKNVDFAGFTCIESDIIYKNYSGELAVGDAIVIKNCGSYSLVLKPPFILPNFPVLEIVDEKIKVIKVAEKFGDVFNTFIF